MPKTALILSSGRTGTQFLAHYFDANYHDVVALHEPPPARWLRFASHAHLRGSLSDDRIRSLLAWKRRHYDDRLDTDFYIESNPFLSGLIDVIGNVWDAPIVIHVVRDPRDAVRSSLNHGTGSGFKGIANRLIPFWYPDVRRILALDHAPSWIEHAAGVWAILNQRLCDAAPRYPHYHRLRYEDLFDDSHSGLRALCTILGLPYRERGTAVTPGARMNQSRLAVLPDWREWNQQQCLSLDRICAPLMREFGYGDEPEWRERIARGTADG
ncbi:MAG: sulfotransferase [Deltaproteobacteria bacterium]|nr:sulfotransferase [Deltaproteobacteria bacterium]